MRIKLDVYMRPPVAESIKRIRCPIPECGGIRHADFHIPGGTMGQVLHGSATTTHAIRTAIQRSKASLKNLAARYGLNQKTVAKWRKRAFVNDPYRRKRTAIQARA
jgi:hypothetical protein